MQTVLALIGFFGGPAIALAGLWKPALYRGGRLRAVGLGFAVSAVAFGLFAVTMTPEQRAASEQARVERQEREAAEAAEREATARQRAQEAQEREAREQRERAERQAVEDRVREERRVAEAQRAAEERARRQAEAAAAERARGPDRLRGSGGGNGAVVVWRDTTAMREAMRLINANVHQTNPRLLMPHVACMAPPGTEIVVTDGGVFSSEVLVVAGQLSGCRGVVPNEEIERRR